MVIETVKLLATRWTSWWYMRVIVSFAPFSHQVGSGSKADCLDGDDLTAFTTSSTVTVLKDDSLRACISTNVDWSADMVSGLASSLFLSMKPWEFSGENFGFGPEMAPQIVDGLQTISSFKNVDTFNCIRRLLERNAARQWHLDAVSPTAWPPSQTPFPSEVWWPPVEAPSEFIHISFMMTRSTQLWHIETGVKSLVSKDLSYDGWSWCDMLTVQETSKKRAFRSQICGDNSERSGTVWRAVFLVIFVNFTNH